MTPRLLDLFCKAGGAGMGYYRAGFEVVGVDIEPQPHYPFEFHQADALTYPLDGFDAIHASPPCQAYSTGSRSAATLATPMLIDAVRPLLNATGLPYVIENVGGARDELRVTPQGYVVLCGSMFSREMPKRHRLFEIHPFVWAPYHPPCRGWNAELAKRLGVDRRRVEVAGHGRGWVESTHGRERNVSFWRRLMDMPWAERDIELSEAIPPAYTEWIGRQLLAAIGEAVA